MTDIQTLQKYENWKSAKKRRKIWMIVISVFAGLLLAYISGNLLCKVGLFKTKKVMSYWWSDKENLKPENYSKLPEDWTTYYKDLKENIWYKNFGKKEDYFTKGEIRKRELEKQGKELGGELGGWLGEWLGSQSLSETEAKKVDYHQYANYVYGHTGLFLIISWILFYIAFYLILRYIVLPLSWKEPKLTEQEV